ncbi:MAG: arsenite methyltransferase [Dehalococcoidia bacterium]
MPNRSPEEIRHEVSRSYGDRVRGVLNADEPLEVINGGGCCAPATDSSSTACCGTETKSDVSCCGVSDDETIVTNVAKLYAEADISDLPTTVTDVAFGCGNPTAISELQPGQVVLDLGSGGGIDCFLASKMVGGTGRVFGVDMTPEMIALARKNQSKVGATNVEFRLGEIEHLPIETETVDVIISNCVINLSPDKDQVFREAFRVLKPAGRLQVSDIVWTKPAPEDIKNDMDQWAGCVAGALLESEYLDGIRRAGFSDVQSVATEYPGGKGIASAAVTAMKPA